MEQKQRIKSSLIKGAIILAIGLAYYIFVRVTSWRIPCVFYEVTGLYCPGCGITRMCVALLQLDFVRAFRSNALVACALPFAAVFGIRYWIRWIKTGKTKLDKLEQVLVIVAFVLMLIFAIARNLPWFSFLAPA